MSGATRILLALLAGLLAGFAARAGMGAFASFVLAALAAYGLLWLGGLRDGSAGSATAQPENDTDSAPVAAAVRDRDRRGLVDRLPVPLMVIGRSGRVNYANAAATRTLPRLETRGHYTRFIRAPAFVDEVARIFAEGGETTLELLAHDGGERLLEVRIGLLPANSGFGGDAQIIVQIEDRTRAHRAEQLRSDFIANASHELRTPLASIIGYVETLRNHARDDPEARERFLGIMAREAGRLQRLVDDLMSLSRIEMSEHVRPAETVSLNRVAADSAAALLPLAESAGITLVIEVPQTGSEVIGDRDQLAQVFGNLIDNAMKYGDVGTEVRVVATPASRAHPDRHGVTIHDTGPGIERRHLHRLTERFYRVNVGQSRNRGGTGLGLAIVKHILNRHRGRLEIESVPGEGSSFTVWMPKARGDESALNDSDPGRQENVTTA